MKDKIIYIVKYFDNVMLIKKNCCFNVINRRRDANDAAFTVSVRAIQKKKIHVSGKKSATSSQSPLIRNVGPVRQLSTRNAKRLFPRGGD